MLATTRDGTATLTRFRAGQVVGTTRVYCCGTPPDRSAFYPHIASFCPECGEVWQREVYTYDFDYRPIPPGKWRVETERCASCDEPAIRREFAELMKEYDDRLRNT
jgi:hypothetical protein